LPYLTVLHALGFYAKIICHTCSQEKKRLKKEKKAAVKEEDDGGAPGTVKAEEASGSDDSDADARKRAVEADLRQAALRSVGKDE